jgi:hypothetical protein
MVLQWCQNGATMVLQWCNVGVIDTLLSWLSASYPGVGVVFEWCQCTARVVSERCERSVTHGVSTVSLRCEQLNSLLVI